jgi:hypothetical protein
VGFGLPRPLQPPPLNRVSLEECIEADVKVQAMKRKRAETKATRQRKKQLRALRRNEAQRGSPLMKRSAPGSVPKMAEVITLDHGQQVVYIKHGLTQTAADIRTHHGIAKNKREKESKRQEVAQKPKQGKSDGEEQQTQAAGVDCTGQNDVGLILELKIATWKKTIDAR